MSQIASYMPDPAKRLELSFPTARERAAHNLKAKQGLNDDQIAEVLGCSRETANRLRSRFRAKYNAVRLACAGGADCSLLSLCA